MTGEKQPQSPLAMIHRLRSERRSKQAEAMAKPFNTKEALLNALDIVLALDEVPAIIMLMYRATLFLPKYGMKIEGNGDLVVPLTPEEMKTLRKYDHLLRSPFGFEKPTPNEEADIIAERSPLVKRALMYI